MLLALLIILGTRELHRQRGINSSPRSAFFRCHLVGTALIPSRSTAGTCWKMLWLIWRCRSQWAALQQHISGVLVVPPQVLLPCPCVLVPSRLSAFLHLWIQRQDLKANVLEHFQNPKINDTCHYKMTCRGSHAWTSVTHQSAWCFLLVLAVPLLCIPQVPLRESCQTNSKELCPGKPGPWDLWVKLMCQKIPAGSTRGLTGAFPHLQIHRKVELSDWSWQLGRTMLPCWVTQPRQGKKRAYHANTRLENIFFLYDTKRISDIKQIVGRIWRWFCTNVQTLAEALAIQPWAMLCLIGFDWCSGTSVCTSSWHQARTFQMFQLSHSQDASHAAQWSLQPKCKDSWSIRPCKLHCVHRGVSVGLMCSYYLCLNELLELQREKNFKIIHVIVFNTVSACQRKNWQTWLIQTSIANI